MKSLSALLLFSTLTFALAKPSTLRRKLQTKVDQQLKDTVKARMADVRKRVQDIQGKYQQAHDFYTERSKTINNLYISRTNKLVKRIQKNHQNWIKFCQNVNNSTLCQAKQLENTKKHTESSHKIALAAATKSTLAIERMLKKLIRISNKAEAATEFVLVRKAQFDTFRTKLGKEDFDAHFLDDYKELENLLADCSQLVVQLDADVEEIQSVLVGNVCFNLHGPEGLLGGGNEAQFEQAVKEVTHEYLASQDVLVNILYAEAVSSGFVPDRVTSLTVLNLVQNNIATPTIQSPHTPTQVPTSPPELRSPSPTLVQLPDGMGDFSDIGISFRLGITKIRVILGFRCRCDEPELIPDPFIRRRLSSNNDTEKFDIERILASDSSTQQQIVALLQEYVTDIFGASVTISGVPCDRVFVKFSS